MSKNLIPTTFSQDFASGNLKEAMKAAGAGSGDLWRVPVDQIITLPGLNVRSKTEEYEAHIESIAASILAEGFYQDKPIGVLVRDDGSIVVRDGHTRLEAVKRAIARGAQIETVPCVSAPRGTTMVDVTVGLVKSNTGRPLAPIEVAVVCKRLVGWGWEVAKIAERLNYTPAYVNDLLGLLEAPEAVQQLVSAGKVAAGTAIKQIKKEGAKAATEKLVAASKEAKGGKVSAKHLKPAKPAKSAKPEKDADPVTIPLLKSILRSLLDDDNFSKLSNKNQQKVLEIVG